MLKYSSYQSILDDQLVSEVTPIQRVSSLSGKFNVSLSRSLLIKWMLTFFIIVIGCTGVARVFAVSSDDVRLDRNVVVQSGDTLWQIATTYKPDGMDTREYIHLIKRSNGMSNSSIQAGEVLLLPQYK